MMEALFFYFGKVILCSGVTFLYYRLFLKDRTFHHYNRFYLLAAVLISMLLPLLKVSYFTLEVNSNMYLLINSLQNLSSPNNSNDDFNYSQICAFLIGLVTFFFLTKLTVGLVKIHLLKKKYNKENFEGISFYQTDLVEAPFSYFKNLFWKNSIAIQSDLGRQILKHEMVHIEQRHSWDKIFIEITTALFWFNPFIYLIKKEINLIHEYLADKKAVKNSDTKAFAQMLLASHFSGKEFPATSPFLSSNLKKRLTMLKKSKTKYSYARRILALPLLFTLAFMYLVNAKNKEIRTTNQEITDYVSTLKKDTIPPPPPPPAPVNEEPPGLRELEKQLQIKEKELKPMNEAITKKSEEAQKLSAEMQFKSKELEKLAKNNDFNSPKFKKLEKEMNALGNKMNLIFESEDFKNSMKNLDFNHAEMDKLHSKIDQYYNSDEFKLKIKDAEARAKEAEKLVNSPAFKKKIAAAEKQALQAEKKINSPEFKKRIEEAEKRANEAADKAVNSVEFKKRIQEAEETAKLAAENGNSKIIILNSNGKNANSDADNIKIFIDGKPVTKLEMENLSPDRIEKMEVNKKGYNGTKSGEIHITTKK
ncbi:M56 family metallopeptidase [Chryseobacterium sp. MDT2-18]|uniref:M56 family metallopeptidase n=1 Tax=Chryseobacterium sp. MDT2-18 TaxID=1259136 RepID=UPI002784CFAF|nr:M56 family metallopeptidase [Chryseobacterium sp. MDT2-18]MDQ0475752.1 putative coiled-coil protein SlyX [Chryseobacterium sp. MDT2-18]